jgi:hypothetical protein
VRKRTPKEKASESDKLGLNTAQYANELHEPHLIPFIEDLEDHPSHIYLVADGAGYHKGKQNKVLQEECSYDRLEWLLNSPDPNLTENCWIILRGCLGSASMRLKEDSIVRRNYSRLQRRSGRLFPRRL